MTRPGFRPVFRPIIVGLTILAGVGLAWVGGQGSLALDEVPAPPETEDFASPSGAYLFRLHAAMDWQHERPQGELITVEGAARRTLWRRDLPQEYRPRLALVSDAGRVLLLDEWWNTKSRYAVMVLDAEGAEVAVHGFDAVRSALGESMAVVVGNAKYGPWIAAPPLLGGDGKSAAVAAAGKHLVVDLETGHLSSAPGSD